MSVPLLSMAPPEVPVVAGDELLVNVLAVTAKVPWLKMAPPPCWPLLARPLLSVSEFKVRLPPLATSKMRKAVTPVALDRVMVDPEPWMVTFPVITGRPVPPSVALLALSSV